MPHRDLLARLLPPVSYDPAAPRLAVSLAAEGAELDRVLAMTASAMGGLIPFSMQQWVADWERVYGLPDLCTQGHQLLQTRLQILALAFLERGGISRAWLKRYAAVAGYDIQITEFKPFTAGSKAGEQLTQGGWRYAFRVTAAGDVARVFRASQSQAGDPLRQWGDNVLECIINKYKPAHTVALIAYT